VDVRIVGRHVEPDNDGQVAIVDARSLPPAARAQLAPDVALKLVPGADPHAVQAALRRDVRNALAVEVTSDEVEGERADLRPVLYAMDLVLLAIGLVNLITTLLLAVRDRVREFGTFKVLGLTPRQILVTVTSSGSVLAALAVAVGIPLGLVAFRVLLRTQSASDGPDIATTPDWWWLALLVPGAILLTALASAIPARVAAAVQPARAVRYE
jgi:putative ABC transport system permease protein